MDISVWVKNFNKKVCIEIIYWKDVKNYAKSTVYIQQFRLQFNVKKKTKNILVLYVVNFDMLYTCFLSSAASILLKEETNFFEPQLLLNHTYDMRYKCSALYFLNLSLKQYFFLLKTQIFGRISQFRDRHHWSVCYNTL